MLWVLFLGIYKSLKSSAFKGANTALNTCQIYQKSVAFYFYFKKCTGKISVYIFWGSE